MQKKSRDVFSRSAAITVISVYLFFFSEWAFHITKPSFLSALTIGEGLVALFMAAAPVTLAALYFLAVIYAVLLIARKRQLGENIIYVAYLPPAAVLTLLALLLAENFTYTLFGFNVGSFGTAGRIVYIVILAATLAWLLTYFERKEREADSLTSTRVIKYAAALLLTISMALVAVHASSRNAPDSNETASQTRKRPNILILSADGIDALNTSAYGYRRPTTPVLDELKKESLHAENSFTNCAHTGCSITSLLTGKSPFATKLIFPPDILVGRDVYEHLPGLLRQVGYRSIDISIRHYADAYDLNMKRGFDVSNGRAVDSGIFGQHAFRVIESISGNGAYFLRQSYERAGDRIYHILGMRGMANPYLAVTDSWRTMKREWEGGDPRRIEELLRFIDEDSDRFFAHVHLLETHGAYFRPRNPVFSKGQAQNAPWMTDFYDDAVSDFDRNIGIVIDHLKRKNLYDKTILVITSDHGKRHTTNSRLPLMIRFPNNEFQGAIADNAQRMDIAPTILKYLGMNRPGWMEGRSLFGESLDPYHPIFSAHNAQTRRLANDKWVVLDHPPPFHSLGGVSVVICDRWYKLLLGNGEVVTEKVEGHTQHCNEEALPDASQVKALIYGKLKESGYRIGTPTGPQ